MTFSCRRALALAGLLALTSCCTQIPDGVQVFLGPPQLQRQTLFANGRFPNVAITREGSVLAVWGNQGIQVRRSSDGGENFAPATRLCDEGIAGGGTTVDLNSGAVFAFAEASHPPAPLQVFRSDDDGRSFVRTAPRIDPDPLGNQASMHMNEHGICLQRGPHKGRLLRPARFYAGQNHRSHWPRHYTNAIYSDDGGRSWQTSTPFPAKGTGEAALVELSDGRIYYNSRRHWAPQGQNPRRRWVAWSHDGGASYTDLQICKALPDGAQHRDYGCMAGLARLPLDGRDILVYSNCDSPKGRRRGTVWLSFDGGRSWPLKRLVEPGSFAYSSLAAGRPGTPSEGQIYLFYESEGARLARFNLSWLLQGEATGDGVVPSLQAPGR